MNTLSLYLPINAIPFIPVILAESIPQLGLFISLVGAVSSTALALIFPPIIEMVMAAQKPGRVTFYMVVKDLVIITLGIFIFVTGTFESITSIIKAFQQWTFWRIIWLLVAAARVRYRSIDKDVYYAFTSSAVFIANRDIVTFILVVNEPVQLDQNYWLIYFVYKVVSRLSLTVDLGDELSITSVVMCLKLITKIDWLILYLGIVRMLY